MEWKNYFYFQQSDKRAILLLLMLIVLSGAVYLLSDSFTANTLDNVAENKSVAEFDTYQKNLLLTVDKENDDIEPLVPSTKYETRSNGHSNSKKLQEGQTIDINAASKASLMHIQGVGEVFAQRILDYRNALGGFSNLEQLHEIKGVGKKKYETIVRFVTLRKSPKHLMINAATPERLRKHPYFSDEQVQNLINYRQQNGKLKSLDELLKINGFSSRDTERLKDYLSF